MTNVGRLIHQTRRLHDLTLSEVATAIEKSKQYMSDIERGRLRGSPETLRKIAAVIGLDEAELADTFLQDAIVDAQQKWNKGTNTGGEYLSVEKYVNNAN